MTTLYGIKNCDTIKKARRWLEEHHIEYTFHDFREDGLAPSQIQQWVAELGWETLVNKRSTTWKTLDETTKAALDDKTVIDVIAKSPTLIKRPLLDTGTSRHVGFKAAEYDTLFIK